MLQRSYTAALRVLGLIPSALRRGLDEDLTARLTAQVQDLADVAPPHSPPRFSVSLNVNPAVGLRAVTEIAPTSRSIRIQHLMQQQFTAGFPRWYVSSTPIITVQQTPPTIVNQGPRADTATALVTEGTTAAVLNQTTLNGLMVPINTIWTPRPAQLLVPGQIGVFEAVLTNQTTFAFLMWEEIPNPEDTTDLGFPE